MQQARQRSNKSSDLAGAGVTAFSKPVTPPRCHVTGGEVRWLAVLICSRITLIFPFVQWWAVILCPVETTAIPVRRPFSGQPLDAFPSSDRWQLCLRQESERVGYTIQHVSWYHLAHGAPFPFFSVHGTSCRCAVMGNRLNVSYASSGVKLLCTIQTDV